MQHRFFSGILPQEYKKRLQIAATAFSSTFRRVNLSLVSCSSAELTSVSVPCKIDFNKLHLQPVKKSSHLQYRPATYMLILLKVCLPEKVESANTVSTDVRQG
jgi:hypothetical protein